MSRKPIWPPRPHPHKPSGQDRVRWRGRDYYLGAIGSAESRAAYAGLIARLAAGEEPGPRRAAAGLTVAEVVLAWGLQERPRYDPRGREAAQFDASLAPLLALFGAAPAADFDADKLDAVRLAMASGSWMPAERRARLARRRQPICWCRNVVNRRVVRIRTVWRWAERKNLVPRGSWGNLLALPGLAPNDMRVRQTGRRKPAAWADVKAVVRQLAPAPRAMLLLQFWSGMRSGEVRIMRACDIDRSGEDWAYRPSRHKGDWRGQERVVALGPKCRAVLRLPLAAAAADAPLFPARPGVAYTAFSYAQVIRRAAGRAGVRLQPYQCRHACKDRVTSALGLDAARAVLGQKSLGTTNGYGTALDLEAARRAARRLG